MTEQENFVDPNSIRMHKRKMLLGLKICSSLFCANGLGDAYNEKFIMLHSKFGTAETVRKLVSFRSDPDREIVLGLRGSDFILGPNIDESQSESTGNIVFGDSSQLRVWVRNPLRGDK